MEGRLVQRDAAFSESSCEEDDCQARLAALDDPDANPETQAIAQEFQDHTVNKVKAFIEKLDERSRYILVNRWLCESGSRLTLAELAARYSISMERVRQIESASIEKLHDYMMRRDMS